MYKLLYIDDEVEHIEDFIEDNEDSFYIETVDLYDDISEMLDRIIYKIVKENFDCVVLDYFLKQTRPMLNYNGGTLAEEIIKKFEGFPVFLLTAKEEDAFYHTIDPLHIISKEKYNLVGGRLHYIKRIELFVKQYKNKILMVEERLIELSEKNELSAHEEIEETELNAFIEKSVIGDLSIPVKKFTRKETDRLDDLIKLAERILDED